MKEFFEKCIDLLRGWLIPVGDPTVLETVGFAISASVGVVFTVLYLYQFFYAFLACVHRPLRYPDTDQTKRYAVLIAARNESQVIPELLKSILGQTYPADRIHTYVVADNCTDNTAEVARGLGATVYERQNKTLVGKGYALEYLLDHIKHESERGFAAYDGYFVIDADNVLRNTYVAEMDKAFSAGHRVVTSYRNSKNYGKTWISAGYSLWFLREARHLNNPRSILHASAAVSGTGFLVSHEIIERNNGWRHFLLTEDIEFTVDCVLHGDKVGYCHRAELFDEQPETFRQSWRQRKRWAKGFFQVFHHYGGSLLKKSLMFRWSCYDMTMNIMPAFILSCIQLLSVLGLFIANLIVYHSFSLTLLNCLLAFFVYGYAILFILGLFPLITEWRHIHCNKFKVLLLYFTFPVFMMTYIPISISALFSRVEWQPIAHKYNVDAASIVNQDIKAVDDAESAKSKTDAEQAEAKVAEDAEQK